MMKMVLHRALPWLCLWPAPLRAELSPVWLNLPSAEIRALSEELVAWKSWEEKFGGANAETKLQVSFIPPAEVSGFGAQTSGRQIKLNNRQSKAQLRQVFRHELAHVFLHERLSPELRASQLLQETFAQLLSGDDARLRREHEIPTSAEALRRLDSRNPKQLEPALARLLSRSETKNELEQFLKSLLASQPQKTTAEDKLKAILAGRHSGPRKGELSYLVIDARTGETLASRGKLHEPRPIGSILKPLVLRLYPELLASQPRGNGPEWACPPLPNAGSMNWREALQASCNGFFLSGGRNIDWTIWSRHLERFGIQRSRASAGAISEAIGLEEKLRLSLSEVAALYREIGHARPEILSALEGSLTRGTLSHLEHSSYFKALKAQLKTGSVRTALSEPVAGWVGGRIGDVYAFAFAPGHSGASLLSELKAISDPWKNRRLAPARIQILGLVPPASLRFQCEAGQLRAGRKELRSATVSDLSPGDQISCLRGALVITLPTNKGAVERKYFGTITYSPPPLKQELAFTRAKQARARRGSAWILDTSERSYVSRVLAAELAGGRTETLKALALVVRQNLHSGRHQDRPLCDTTHCQVFGTAAGGARYAAAYDAIAHAPLKEGQFSNFALGGSKPWSATLSHRQLRLRTGLNGEIFSVTKRGEEIWVNQRRFSCEEFRNLFALNSCPSSVSSAEGTVRLEGTGEGHGVGIDLIKADLLAANGLKYEEILARFAGERAAPSR